MLTEMFEVEVLVDNLETLIDFLKKYDCPEASELEARMYKSHDAYLAALALSTMHNKEMFMKEANTFDNVRAEIISMYHITKADIQYRDMDWLDKRS